ncbi:MAG: exodeoxyribonuclease VII small subunit [Anaerolineales bacterium]
MSNSKPIEAMTYEETFAELQAVVAALEGEGRPLDEAIALYERGQSLARHCASLLEKAELKVHQLNGEISQEGL